MLKGEQKHGYLTNILNAQLKNKTKIKVIKCIKCAIKGKKHQTKRESISAKIILNITYCICPLRVAKYKNIT